MKPLLRAAAPLTRLREHPRQQQQVTATATSLIRSCCALTPFPWLRCRLRSCADWVEAIYPVFKEKRNFCRRQSLRDGCRRGKLFRAIFCSRRCFRGRWVMRVMGRIARHDDDGVGSNGHDIDTSDISVVSTSSYRKWSTACRSCPNLLVIVMPSVSNMYVSESFRPCLSCLGQALSTRPWPVIAECVGSIISRKHDARVSSTIVVSEHHDGRVGFTSVLSENDDK
jgi:hypothetical protein